MDLNKAKQTQLDNIAAKTGQSLDALATKVNGASLQKHGEKLAWIKDHLDLGHGDANALAHFATNSGAPAAKEGDPVDELYAGPKATLRPIHDAIMTELSGWGDFEIHPKKGYLALRRKKQFAMLGPATNSRVELGLNAKELPSSERLLKQKPGGMCQFRVQLTEASQVDKELFSWLRTAFEASGQ